MRDFTGNRRRYGMVALFGAIVAIIQVVLLREILEAAGGDELSLALGLTVWLLGSALGAAAASYLPSRFSRPMLAGAGVLLAGLPFLSLLLARDMLRIFHLGPGELLSLPQQFSALLMTLLPVCILSGAIFSLATKLPLVETPSVYIAEAAGWLLGGLAATWIFVGAQPFAIFSMMAYFSLGAVLMLWNTSWAPAAVALFGFLCGHSLPSTTRLQQSTLSWRWPARKIIADRYGMNGHGIILQQDGQRVLYVNGHLAQMLPEVRTSEELANLVMLQRSKPTQVLLVGGTGGLLPEVLKYPVHWVDVAEEDEAVANLALGYADPRTQLQLPASVRARCVYTDARHLIQSQQWEKWDAILLNTSPPNSVLINRYYTMEFFRAARHALLPGGVLAFALPGSDNNATVVRNGAIYRSLSTVFRYVAVTRLATNCFLASDEPLCFDPKVLRQRLATRHIATPLVNRDYFAGMLERKQAQALAMQYLEVADVNSDMMPVVYLHGALQRQQQAGRGSRLYAAVSHWRPWQAGVVLFGLLIFGSMLPAVPWRRKWPARWTMLLPVAILGFAGMAFSILFFLVAQQALGALYHLLGMLIALGMAGIVLGAWMGPRLGWRGLYGVMTLEVALAVLLPLLASALPGWPLALAFLMLGAGMMLAGAGVGMIFPLAVSTKLSPGLVYSTDLIGAAFAGIITGVILIPAHGLWVSCGLLAGLLLVAIIACGFSRNLRLLV